MLRYFYGLLFLFCQSLLLAQTSTKFDFQSIGPNEGMSIGYNNHFIRRQNEVMWISSENGIYEYDGVNLTHMNSATTHRTGRMITSDFYEFSNGDIVYSATDGWYYYNNLQENFLRLYSQLELPQSDDKGIIIGLENDEIIWAVKGGNILKIQLPSGNSAEIAESKGVNFSIRDHNQNHKVIISAPWLMNPGIEVYHLDNDSLVSYQMIIYDNNFGSLPNISETYVQNDSIVWAISTEGIFKIDYNKGEVVNHIKSSKGTSNRFTFYSTIDSNTLLLSNRTEGIWKLDLQQNEISKYLGVENGLKSEKYRGVYIDDSENIWLSQGHTSIVNFGIKKRNYFHTTHPKIEAFGRNFRMIRGNRGNVFSFVDNNFSEYTKEGILLRKENIQYLFPTYSGQIRLMSSCDLQPVLLAGNSIAILENHEWRIIKVFDKSEIFNISCLEGMNHVLRSQNQIFISDDLKTKPSLLKTNDLDISLLNTKVLANRGKFLYLLQNDVKLISVKINEDSLIVVHDVLFENPVYDITFTHDTLCITTSKSIHLYDSSLQTGFSTVSQKTSQGTFYSTQVHNGNYWISSNNGLWQYNPKDDSWLQFLQCDGLLNTEFCKNQSLLLTTDTSCHMWFGSLDGINIFSPDSIIANNEIPIAHIKNLFINDSLIHRFPLGKVEELSLPYNRNKIKFSLLAVSYQNQDANKIKYRIKGLDNEWQYGKNGKLLNLSLSPNDYILELIPISSNGLEGDVRSFAIKIKPPFWQTIWFNIIAGSVLIITVFQFTRVQYKKRISRQLEEFEKQKVLQLKLDQERNRIASEMHDDLGGGLTSIKLLAKRLQKSNTSPLIHNSLEKMEAYSSDLVENMRMIIWSMNGENNGLKQTIAYLRHYISSMLENGDIHSNFEVTIAEGEVAIRGEIRRNIILIVKEIVHNIIKHSKATEAEIKIDYNGALIKLNIKDNGIGFKSDSENAGQGLRNIYERAKNIDADIHINSKNGAEIRLTIPINHHEITTN